MLAKLKAWWRKLRGKDVENGAFTIYHPSPAPMLVVSPDPEANLMTLTGPDEDIFAIDGNGNAIWLKEESYDDAAEMFLNVLGWQIEQAAGIQQSRMEWEEHITEKLVAAAEANGGSISADELTEVIRKCIMYDKLKGKYGEN